MRPPAARAGIGASGSAAAAPARERADLRVIFIPVPIIARGTARGIFCYAGRIMRTAVCVLMGISLCQAWHDPVHARITRAALRSLPPAMQQQWAAQADRLIVEYSLYPDAYAHVPPATRDVMRRYCSIGARNIHNVTWDRREDIESIDYLSAGIV